MNILITGANGFIGRNLMETLKNIRDGKDRTRSVSPALTLFTYEVDTDPSLLATYCAKADFVFHLAGVNRPEDPNQYMEGNFGFSMVLLDTLKKAGNRCPVMLSSSIQAEFDNPYGRSKKAGEELLFQYAAETGAPVFVYRFPNVFGKWCRPNYNSAVGTFCYNIARDLPITVNDPDVNMHLVYIDDVVDEALRALEGAPTKTGAHCSVPVAYEIRLGRIVELLYAFRTSRNERSIPDMSDDFTRKLYATYTSYLPADGLCYALEMKCDVRGSFTEAIRTSDRGQYSVSISKPGVVRGNHWHHTKNEKFIVISGRGIIRFRQIGNEKIVEYPVSGERLQVVDVPAGYTHNIENIGDTDMATIMWCSECFDPDKPDTYYEEV